MNAAGTYDMAETGGCHSLLTAIPAEVTEAPNPTDTVYDLFHSRMLVCIANTPSFLQNKAMALCTIARLSFQILHEAN